MKEVTTLTRASNKSKTLRTTVPIIFVKLFNLKEGDKLEWELKEENGEKYMIVKVVKGDKNDKA